MSIHSEVKEFRLWKAISQQFPNAEIIRPDGSRKKLSAIFNRAPEKKSPAKISFQGAQKSYQQLSFDFGNGSKNGGAK
ncbi:MAG: hypothetical protein ABFD08_07830 [Syntrophomonas sp.]